MENPCYPSAHMISICAQGFPGDFGEMGPHGPDGNPVSEMLHNNTYCSSGAVHLNPQHITPKWNFAISIVQNFHHKNTVLQKEDNE